MKIFKLDLMTVLVVVVAIGVAVTMSTQASDQTLAKGDNVQVSVQTVSTQTTGMTEGHLVRSSIEVTVPGLR